VIGAALALALILPSTCTATPAERYETIELVVRSQPSERPAHDAAQRGVEAGLRSLASGPPELRVWSRSMVSSHGIVVTRDRVRVYTDMEVVDGVARHGPRVALVSSRRQREAQQLLRLFARLGDLDGASVRCPTQDGVSYTIEMRSSAGRFAFEAGNPRSCDHPDAVRIARALRQLDQVVGDIDLPRR
jgi:hypothetical protein